MRSFHLKPWSSFIYRDILDYCFIASTCNFEQLIAIVCVWSVSPRVSLQVQSIMERVIVFLLSQVVDSLSEEEVLFSQHPRTESCKLLWRDSQVVGFYTVKHKGRMEEEYENDRGRVLALEVFSHALYILTSAIFNIASCCSLFIYRMLITCLLTLLLKWSQQ